MVMPATSKQQLARDRAALGGQMGLPQKPLATALTPLKMSHSVRLAVGGLGFTNNALNRELGDLVTVNLTGTRGFELVERDSLSRILEEQKLTWSGLVRAKDVVRVGKLLKTEWFLLGTQARIAGADRLVVRVVDARTGIIRDAGVYPADVSQPQLAAMLAGFLREVRENAAQAKLHEYLAVGNFEDMGLNNRLADFPAQLHGYLTAAYHGANVTLLEREAVETLLREVDLDLAGLTEETSMEPPAPMQSAFWLVAGQYQSYESTNLQVEVNVEVHRIFGRTAVKTIRAAPGEPVERLVKKTADEIMKNDDLALIPTRATESRIQLWQGENIAHGSGPRDSVLRDSLFYWSPYADSQTEAKLKRRLENAIRAFKAALLLEPANREAKMYLATCMGNGLDRHPDEARRYYQEIIDEPVNDKWTVMAERALVQTFRWFGPGDRLRWLKLVASQTTNDAAADFYRQQIQAAEEESAVNASDNPETEKIAERRLFEQIRIADDFFHHKAAEFSWDLGMEEYL
jgi:TolB-like protein